MAAKDGDKVKIHYTGKLQGGEEFDSSVGKEPLEFTIGEGNIIPGFEKGVLGMSVGDKKTIEIPCMEAYGAIDPESIFKVPLEKMGDDMKPEKGMMLQMSGPKGHNFMAKIIDFDEETLTLDANHPLAGKDLTFDLEMVEIK